MVFTTQLFTFVFLPISVFAYLLVDKISDIKWLDRILTKIRAKDIILILFSLVFYAWACFDNVYRLIIYIVLLYALAELISYFKNKNSYVLINSSSVTGKFYLSKIPFVISVAIITFFLIYYNYSAFITELWNKLLGDSLTAKSLVAPLGLSFITFSSISYLIDIYRGNAEKGNLVDCFLYITFFPKVISGPIVLYKDFKIQISQRKCSIDKIASGINKIIIGFAKKVILADTFGACLAKIGLHNIDAVTAIGILVLYMLQIYYDFAGYSDIAIGVSRIFGFDFKEIFNFPYRSKSISEFWRRWHISLGTWFREYVYFPLGGSRVTLKRNLFNLGVVFALTGIWHGAGWNYIIWGAINGGFVILERAIRDKKAYIKTPNAIKYIATMLIVLLFWQFFKYQSVHNVISVLKIATGITRFDAIPYTWQYYYDLRIIIFTVIGILGSTVLGSPKLKVLQERIVSTKVGYIVEEIGLFAIFVIAVLFMVNSTYSPFIYFQY